MIMKVSSETKQASLEMVVTRANGTVENLGVVSYYSKNPFKRWAVNLWIYVKQLTRRH